MDYTYQLTDFPNNVVDVGSLSSEIQESAIIIALNSVTSNPSEVIINFKAELGTNDLAVLDQLVATHQAIPLEDEPIKTTIANIPDVVVRKPLTPQRAYAFSHNWCDKTTWYTMSEKVVDKNIGTGDGSTKTFVLESDYPVIEIGRGKITDDHVLKAPDGGDYLVKIQVGTTTGGFVTLTEREPFELSGGDYWIDYDNPGTEGTMIHFENAPTIGDEIVATYYRCNTDIKGHSIWYFMPPAGKRWVIDHVEAQFTADVSLTDTIIYQAWVNHPIYGWIPVPGQNELRYYSAHNYDDYVKGAQPEVPAWGGSGSRGRHIAGRVVQWDYQSSIVLNSSSNVAIRVWCKHDRAMDGSRVTITIYAMEEDEL